MILDEVDEYLSYRFLWFVQLVYIRLFLRLGWFPTGCLVVVRIGQEVVDLVWYSQSSVVTV